MDKPKKKNGGKRPGSGRKKAVVEAAKLLTAKEVYGWLEQSIGPACELLLTTVKDPTIERDLRMDAAKFLLNKVLNTPLLTHIAAASAEEALSKEVPGINIIHPEANPNA